MIGDGPTLQKQGYTLLAVGEPVFMLKAAAQKVVDELRGAAPRQKLGTVEHG